MRLGKSLYDTATHLVGQATGSYYFEDFVRVYPDGIYYNRLGRRQPPSPQTLNNFKNHCKFYEFAAQFVANKRVADIGCGSGYGCGILAQAGASAVYGSDISRSAIKFAQFHYGQYASFAVQGITDLKHYPPGFVDIAISSEVLEHIKEYGLETQAVAELSRITRPNGLVIIATPNNELLPTHGFSFDEIEGLARRYFREFCIFENALLPFGQHRQEWEDRARRGRTGIVVSEAINLAEIVLYKGETPALKTGIDPGIVSLGPHTINTHLLHNSHSWIVLAINAKSADR